MCSFLHVSSYVIIVSTPATLPSPRLASELAPPPLPSGLGLWEVGLNGSKNSGKAA